LLHGGLRQYGTPERNGPIGLPRSGRLLFRDNKCATRPMLSGPAVKMQGICHHEADGASRCKWLPRPLASIAPPQPIHLETLVCDSRFWTGNSTLFHPDSLASTCKHWGCPKTFTRIHPLALARLVAKLVAMVARLVANPTQRSASWHPHPRR
jgi:hypothetical protein